MFRHKSWANAQLFGVLSSLPPEQNESREAGPRTLDHCYVVDRIFRAHLCGEPRPFDATKSQQPPDLESLQCSVAETDAWYEGFVAGGESVGLSDVIEFTFTSGNPGRMTREEILLHVITHGVYHRGGVAQVLKSIGVLPPDDPFTVFLHQTEPHRRRA
jgi:uncharacterized damage-inducible protein DinB